jgi:4-diphosphocytidyl-2-C-methyl-D-erythritol kinase
VEALILFSPAKINLFLAITGRRADGFHDLVSVVAPLDFGDHLELRPAAAGTFVLECDEPAVPLGEENLILRAAREFVAGTGWRGGARFRLRKRIPIGAGLGGGSSNAVAALRGLNQLSGGALDPAGVAGGGEAGFGLPAVPARRAGGDARPR